MFIREETIKIPLPIKEQYFQLDMPAPTETLSGEVPMSDSTEGVLLDAKENMGVAAYMIRSIALWGRIITYLNQGGKELDPHTLWHPESTYTRLTKEADDLLANTPPSLIYSAENLRMHDTEKTANQYLFLHISMQQNILFLSRVAVATPGGQVAQDVPKSHISKVGAKTFTAANRISEILRDAEPFLVSAPFMGYCAFSSATIHIIGIFSGNPSVENASKKNLATNVKYLSKMKRYWGMFHWMSENLREQYRSCADTARQGLQNGERKTAGPIFQYGDWFDRYPHGVSGSDFVDPASAVKKEKGEDAVLEQKPELHTVEEFFTSLSPPPSTEGNPPGRSTAKKRKSQADKPAKKAPNQTAQQSAQPPEPLPVDFRGPPGVAEQHAMSAPVGMPAQRRSIPGQMGQEPPGSFGAMPIPQNQEAPYHAMSPISPVNVGQYGQQPFYPPNLLSMSLGQQANEILQPLDRQLVFGACSMDPGVMSTQPQPPPHDSDDVMGGIANWQGMGVGGRPGMNGRMMSQGGMPQQQQQQFAGFDGGEASSAWFMPFNMEPPEIGDMGLNMDAFGGMFGTGGGPPPGGP